MRLFIAEKPSLARAISAVLAPPLIYAQGFIQCGNNDVVTWCIGHLLTFANPDDYDPRLKHWRLEDLPIIPHKWQYRVKKDTQDQFYIVQNLINQADEIVHAGDPDREGQLLVDELFAYCKLPKEKIARIKRCLINDLTPASVKQAVNNLQKNTDFIPLATSALARSRADWLFGINLTRAYTLLGAKEGKLLSVGRVQTPVLALVCTRDRLIKDFVPQNFYELKAYIGQNVQMQQSFRVMWQPNEGCKAYQDQQGRVLSRQIVEQVCAKIAQKEAQVIEACEKIEHQAPPLPYSLSSLQIQAARDFGFSADKVLDICQNLYEKYKLITYPRSDCRFLPEAHFQQSTQLIEVIMDNIPHLKSCAKELNLQQKSQAFNDQHISSHHAIIPTLSKIQGVLTDDEQKIYALIARQYLMQFCSDAHSSWREVVLSIVDEVFKARSSKALAKGWKIFVHDEQDEVCEMVIPPCDKGDILFCERGELLERQTLPPLAFSDATLLSAMTHIARFVDDPSLKKILRETDGLGTEATRSSIIKLLFDRGFIERREGAIRATDLGFALFDALPDEVKKPDRTAIWERELNEIATNNKGYHDFMNNLHREIASLLAG